MINIFRKIRYDLMGKNKTGRYLKYAIGEIALVVIGILIALSINNWNEERKDRKIETQALINLKAEFEKNMEHLAFIVTIKQKQERTGRIHLEIITNDTIPLSEKINSKTGGGFDGTWNATNAVLNSLLSTGDITKIKNDSLKFLLTNWSVRVDRYTELEKRHKKARDDMSDYKSNLFYRTIVKPGDYSDKWPGNYYPNNIASKINPLRASLLTDVKYYNLKSQIITSLYIQQMVAKNIKEEYEIISKLIDQELKY